MDASRSPRLTDSARSVRGASAPATRVPHLLGAAALAAAALLGALHLPLETTFPGPIAPDAGAFGAAKRVDVVAAAAFVLTFAASVLGLGALRERIAFRWGQATAEAFDRHLTWCSSPLLIGVGATLPGGSDVRGHVVLAAALCGLLVCTWALTVRHGAHWNTHRVAAWTGLALTVVALSSASVVVAAYALDRSLLAVADLDARLSGAVVAALGISAALLALWRVAVQLRALPPDAPALPDELTRLLTWAQLALPLGVLSALPTPWALGERRLQGYAVTGLFVLALFLFVAAAWGELAWRARRPATTTPRRLAWLGLFALVLFATLPESPTPTVPFDDYHYGEFVVPWWAYSKHGLMPFADITPARGLIHYVPGALASLLYPAQHAAADLVAYPLAGAVLLGIAFTLTIRTVGPKWALLGALAYRYDSRGATTILVAAALVVFSRELFRRPERWLAAWCVTSVTLVLVGVGEGALLALGTAPLALTILVRSWRLDRKRTLAAAAATFTSLGLFLGLTPFGSILAGAVRYGLEQSRVNALAHGLPWAPDATLSAFEWVRSGWLGVALVAFLVAREAWCLPDGFRRRRTLALSLTAALTLGLFSLRALARVDKPFVWSRSGDISTAAAVVLLPALALALPRRKSPLMIAVVAVWIGSATGGIRPPHALGFFFGMEPRALSLRAREAIPVPALPDPADEATLLPLVGLLPPRNSAQYASLDAFLARTLDPDDTYVDLTNRTAAYRYVERPPPIDAPIYNLATAAEQARALKRIIDRDIEVAWCGPRVGPPCDPSLRAHLLYRYFVTHGTPVRSDGLTFLVRGAALGRLGDALSAPDPMALLVEVFHPGEIGLLPADWGRSVDAWTLPAAIPVNLGPREDPGGPRVLVPKAGRAVLRCEFPTPVRGQEAGLLVLDVRYARRPATPPQLEVRWGDLDADPAPAGEPGWSLQLSAPDGRLAIPLDACPRWLLAERLSWLELELVWTGFPVSPVQLDQASLRQRRGVEVSAEQHR